MRKLIVAILLGACLSASGSVLIPSAPRGWEVEVAPGFNPSIESVIVASRDGCYSKTSFKEQLEKWGPDAVPAIIRLYENPKWADIRYVMSQMLAESSSEESKTYLLGRFEALTVIPQPSEVNDSEMKDLCNVLIEYGPTEFRERLLREARQGNTAYAARYSTALLAIGDNEALGAMTALRERLGRTWGPPDILDHCISQLRGRMRAQEPIVSAPAMNETPLHRRNPELRGRLLDKREPRLRDYDAARAVSELVKAEGDKAVKFLSDLATNPEASVDVRRQALVGLGLLGTDKAVKAYVKLRNEAFKKGGAPKPNEQCTYAAKIAEAAIMTIHVIPGDQPPLPCTDPGEPTLKRVWISEDYATATMDWRDYIVLARRFGSEWLVIEALPQLDF